MTKAPEQCSSCGGFNHRGHKCATLSGADRQAKYREGQKKLGRRGRLYYLTDEEKEAIDSLLDKLRESP